MGRKGTLFFRGREGLFLLLLVHKKECLMGLTSTNENRVSRPQRVSGEREGERKLSKALSERG